MWNAIKYLFTAHDIRLSFRIANILMKDDLRFYLLCIHNDGYKLYQSNYNNITKIYGRRTYNRIEELLMKMPEYIERK